MKLPATYEKCLSILILRTLNLSQDAVASMVRCGKSTVVEVEQWISVCPLDEAINLCDDQAVRALVGREFPGFDEISGDILVKAGKLQGEDILRHYREDFMAKQLVQDPLVREATRKHTLELRSILTEWINQIPPPAKLPYAAKVWLIDEMPREMLYEMFEQPDTNELFEDALENQEEMHSPRRNYHLPIESNPAFADLLEHLSGHSIVDDLEHLKKQSFKLAFDYGMLTAAIIQIISDTSFRQFYARQRTTMSDYGEIIRVVKASRTTARIVGVMLSCDLFAHALTESRSKSSGVTFTETLREVRTKMAVVLPAIVHDSNQLSADLTHLARILWDDRDDYMQVQSKVRDILRRLERLQKSHDKLQGPFQLLLNEHPFPGKCSSCPH